MDYQPSDREKNLAAVLQMAAIVGVFIPGIIVGRTRLGRRSPYVRYWIKASIIWSVIVTMLIAGGVAAAIYRGTTVPLVLIVVVHFLLCVNGALASASGTRFRYLFVGALFCRLEASYIWRDTKLAPADRPNRRTER